MKRYNMPHRSRVVKTRLTDEEYADFTARLAPYGMSQSEFIRQAITRATIRQYMTFAVLLTGNPVNALGNGIQGGSGVSIVINSKFIRCVPPFSLLVWIINSVFCYSWFQFAHVPYLLWKQARLVLTQSHR